MEENCEDGLLNNNTTNKKIKKEKKPSLWSTITLEPMWLGVVSSLTIYIVTLKNFFLDRACSYDLNYPIEICSARNETIEQSVQEIVSFHGIGSGFLAPALSCLTILFLGPWSDKTGRRKPLIFFPILMIVLSALLLLIFSFNSNVSTGWIMYSSNVIISLGGHMSVLNLGAFSYLGDYCERTNLCPTLIMGRNTAMISLSLMLGSIIGPLLYRYLSYPGLFGGCFLLAYMSLLYVWIRVKETTESESKINLFNIKLPINAFQCLFKSRTSYRNRNIYLMLVVQLMLATVNLIDIAITYLYLRKQFDWTEFEYGLMQGSRFVLQFLGIFGGLQLFKKCLKMKDEHIALIGGISEGLGVVMLIFATKNWMVYSSVALQLFGGLPIALLRPIIFQQIMPNEQGRINCVFCVLEMIAALFTIPIINIVYNLTLMSFPKAFLIF